MAILTCYVDDITMSRLQAAASDLGSDVDTLAENAISEAALAYDKERRIKAEGQETFRLHP